MAKYTGSKCICCEKRFVDEDDIVVCPDCGTPYHRACYMEKGSCINSVLHDKGVGWLPDAPAAEPAAPVLMPAVKRCIRCGAENDPELRYCEQCGTPLINMDAPRPFNDFQNGGSGVGQGEADRPDMQQGVPPHMAGPMSEIGFTPVMLNQDSDIDGVKLGDYARYVGANPIGFLPSFIKFAKTGRKLSMNIFAFLFTPVYFMYRKMKGWGIAVGALMALLGVPSMINMLASGELGYKVDIGIDVESQGFLICSELVMILTMGLKCLAGLFANYLYYRQAKKDIVRIRGSADGKTGDDINKEIVFTGGTSVGYMVLGYMVYLIVSVGSVLLISRFV